MCGIAGFLGNYNASLLDSMGGLLSHRGPDDLGKMHFEIPGGASLGLLHTRLSIIDLSALGHQPMTVKCECCQSSNLPHHGKIWLSYNGEIYNYQSLRRELESQGHAFTSQTDSEVLLHLYRQYGPLMLEKLNGIFAFALYDGKTQELFVARDQLGVKPLYYAQTGAGFLFASELKAILADATVSREIDPVAVDHYLTYLWSPAPRTMLKSIKKLAPGHAMIIKRGRIARHWRYYDIPMEQPLLVGSFDQVAAELAEKVNEAVVRQMVSDVPVGAFLSGGLDSSAIVAMMCQQQAASSIDCYTIRVQDDQTNGFSDDLPYAQKVAKHLGVKLNIVDASPHMIERLPEMLFYLDEPQADPAPINALLISEQARHNGLKVLMSGAGGDDIFTGYRRHAALNYDRYWRWAPQKIRAQIASASRKQLSQGRAVGNKAMMRRLAKLFAHTDLDGDAYLASFFHWNTAALRQGLYTPSLLSAVQSNEEDDPLVQTLAGVDCSDRVSRMLYLELKHFLADHNLNYTDRASMAAGIEARVPLLDLDLVNYAMQIPSHYKQRGRVGKAIFKRAMEPYLPKEVIYRPKSGFGAPLRHWLRTDLSDTVHYYLSENSLRDRGLFDPDAVRCLIERDQAGQGDASYTIFALLCIEIWCRQFIDAPIPAML